MKLNLYDPDGSSARTVQMHAAFKFNFPIFNYVL